MVARKAKCVKYSLQEWRADLVVTIRELEELEPSILGFTIPLVPAIIFKAFCGDANEPGVLTGLNALLCASISDDVERYFELEENEGVFEDDPKITFIDDKFPKPHKGLRRHSDIKHRAMLITDGAFDAILEYDLDSAEWFVDMSIVLSRSMTHYGYEYKDIQSIDISPGLRHFHVTFYRPTFSLDNYLNLQTQEIVRERDRGVKRNAPNRSIRSRLKRKARRDVGLPKRRIRDVLI